MDDEKPAAKGANLNNHPREPDLVDRLAYALLDNRERLLAIAQVHGNVVLHLAGNTARIELRDIIIV